MKNIDKTEDLQATEAAELDAETSDEITFESFGIRSELLKAISRKGFTSPTPVQQKVLEAGDDE
ncbi:MAG: hypothetical protein LBJ22_03055, partial [Synergistaceae bacterium]|nr:hypothetical protein [Synergistaceae bacterium]